jgi:hypothetical protein
MPDDIEAHGVYEAYCRLRRALKDIDAVAVQKKAGAAVRMQRIARAALAESNGISESNPPPRT